MHFCSSKLRLVLISCQMVMEFSKLRHSQPSLSLMAMKCAHQALPTLCGVLFVNSKQETLTVTSSSSVTVAEFLLLIQLYRKATASTLTRKLHSH
ncbi:JK_21P [Escherichia phage Jk06]|uniref:JK_21P n=1 Tax=Escherichia phage Jk06 TaxID=2886922 RepID=Q45PZ4_9CAUD|nr:hypothetical protein JK_21 [Escherichia phage Jk06]AAZ29271.1 JK_21P [Escherichia phage Jk06]